MKRSALAGLSMVCAALARFLTAASVYRDMEQLPPFLRQPGIVARFMSAPHDRTCLTRLFDDLVIAMVGGGTGTMLDIID